jgi:glycosyltransferase involved in cell wall biosynthesis
MILKNGRLDMRGDSLFPAESRVVVFLPCYNEELTIGQVVGHFREVLPRARIIVYDNNSKDNTAEVARRAGAEVRHETRQGKGFVIQAMFREIEADYYVMMDGDGTYDPGAVMTLLEAAVEQKADMVIGSRLSPESVASFRWVNRLGNMVFRALLNSLFGVEIEDLLSGYRVFSPRVVRGTPLFDGGFATETEMTIRALEHGLKIVELPVSLVSRPEGSFSKISHLRDGFLILRTIVSLWRDYRPLKFFGAIALLLCLLGLAPGIWSVGDFLVTGKMQRLGALLLAVTLELSGLVFFFAGLLMHSINQRFREVTAMLQAIGEDQRRGPS